MATKRAPIVGQSDRPSKNDLKEAVIKAALENKETADNLASETRLARIKTLFGTAANSRRRYDWEWLARDLFIRGFHYSRYNPANKTVTLATRSSTRIPVNLVAAHMRVIKNQVTAFRPKWEVMPNAYSNNSIEDAQMSGKLLDSIYIRERIREKIKEAVIDGLKTSVAWWQVVWDSEYYDRYGNKGDVRIWSLDPFDVYIDPYATSIQDAEFVIKAVRTSLDAIKKNPNYKVPDNLGGTSKLAESEYKQFLLQSVKMLGQYQTPDNDQQILKEAWVKERGENGRVKVRITHYLDSMERPLYEELSDEEDLSSFCLYRADINPREIYGESWAKHIIPINRVINALESSKFDYNYRYAKGRLVMDKNSGVRVVTNEHGSIIEKNRGSEVTSLPLQPLPSTYDTQLDKMVRYFEDISGAHDASLGRLPTGITSGVAIAELKQADACVDIETEALTKRGWMKYDQLLDGEDIYCLDPDSHTGRWGKLNKVFYYDKAGVPTYQFETRNISCIATTDHSWLVVNANGNWSHQESQTLKNDHHIPLALPSSSLPTETPYSDDFVELVGWVITEGSYSLTQTLKNRGSRDIRIYQTKPDGVARLMGLFDRLAIDRKPFLDNRGCWQFSFAGDNAQRIRDLFPDKQLTPEFVTSLPKHQLQRLLDAMIAGDGSVSPLGRRCFINTKKITIDALQIACSLLGINTTVSEYDDGDDNHAVKYVLYLKDSTRVSVGKLIDKGQMTPVSFTGRVWCPNTDAGYWLARRSGKVFYTGNTNQDDLVDNLEHFLEDVGMKILSLMAKHYTTPRVIEATGSDKPYDYFAVVGESGGKRLKDSYRVGKKDYPLVRLTEKNQIRVNIGSWLAFTKEARQKELKELFEIQAIDQKTLLQHLEFGDIDTIMERSRSEAILKSKRGAPGNTETGVSEEELALSENEMMLEGDSSVQAQPQDDHQTHLAVHQEALGGNYDDIVNAHIQQHEALATQSPTPQIPQPPAIPGNPPGVMQPDQLAMMAQGSSMPVGGTEGGGVNAY